MSTTRSIIHKLPIGELNLLLERVGLQKTWLSILAKNLTATDKAHLDYIRKDKIFKDVEKIDFDFLDGLSVGEISVLYEYSLAYVDRDKRKQEGQFFTPDDVAEVMAKKAALFPKNKVWVDPCSGIGNLSYWLVKQQSNPEKFLKNNLILIDRDPLALLIARVIFTVHFQNKEKHLFKDIESRFVVLDFLETEKLPRFDYALLNPPYVNVSPDNRFVTSETRDLYAYFLERVIKNSQGFVSITPQTFTNGRRFDSLRQLLIRSFKDINVYCFDNVPDNIFRGIKFGSKNTNTANSTRAAIIVARQSGENKTFKITPLLRWRAKERKQLLESIDSFLTEVEPRVDIFPKIHRELLPLYQNIRHQQKTLAHIVSRRQTPYKLTVPSTPRYFISALKRPVERSSLRTLYFYSEQERNIAYLLLNSSYMYWWWRVNDGGMTISEKTLLTLPVLDKVSVDTKLLRKIEKSEITNLVIKRNAGKDNQNVKHDTALVKEINEKLFPEFANALGSLHSNSVI